MYVSNGYSEARQEGSYAYDNDPQLSNFLNRCRRELDPPRQDKESSFSSLGLLVRGMVFLQLNETYESPTLQHALCILGPVDVLWIYVAYPPCGGPRDTTEVEFKLRAMDLAESSERQIKFLNGPKTYIYVDRTDNPALRLTYLVPDKKIDILALSEKEEDTSGKTWWSSVAGSSTRITPRIVEHISNCAILNVHKPRPQLRLGRYLLVLDGNQDSLQMVIFINNILKKKDILTLYYAHGGIHDPDEAQKYAESLRAHILESQKVPEEQVVICLEPAVLNENMVLTVALDFGCDTLVMTQSALSTKVCQMDTQIAVMIVT